MPRFVHFVAKRSNVPNSLTRFNADLDNTRSMILDFMSCDQVSSYSFSFVFSAKSDRGRDRRSDTAVEAGQTELGLGTYSKVDNDGEE
ncbi:hypothetical protein RRG08_018515 [Elysia crispata]|uniref:Uncharacterized protein n=1 Tax=Elysia crispata TaxID=231223 RepID=A0AAE1DWT8_9GAST|nr:hypothetical protein RRG08_018515 [Elysia crispata]